MEVFLNGKLLSNLRFFRNFSSVFSGLDSSRSFRFFGSFFFVSSFLNSSSLLFFSFFLTGGAIKIRQPPARKSDKGRGTAEQKPIKQAGEESRVSPFSSAESDLTVEKIPAEHSTQWNPAAS